MNAVHLFQDFQRIYGFCACCGEPFRLSDATLFYRASPPRTPWDDLDAEYARLERAEERLFNDTARLREKAQEAGRKEMERRLHGLMSFFRRQRISLRDMKLLFHPVDYVVFHGLSDGRCSEVEFLDCEPVSTAHERLQQSIGKTIDAGNYSWITMRIADDGQVTCLP
ncbi:MAG: Endonuclease related to archaeal Holliday junction resolvase [Gammaproteobacteria bacterium]|nr:Endonuclease related to archaeal Holliday junction resolvase [Gammaproteobacteria bacterium]